MSWEYADFLNPPINIWRGTKQTRGLTTAPQPESFPRMITRFTIYLLSTFFIHYFHFFCEKVDLRVLQLGQRNITKIAREARIIKITNIISAITLP